MRNTIALAVAGATAFLMIGWVFRIAEHGWIADGRDLGTFAAYLALMMASLVSIRWI